VVLYLQGVFALTRHEASLLLCTVSVELIPLPSYVLILVCYGDPERDLPPADCAASTAAIVSSNCCPLASMLSTSGEVERERDEARDDTNAPVGEVVGEVAEAAAAGTSVATVAVVSAGGEAERRIARASGCCSAARARISSSRRSRFWPRICADSSS